MRPVNLIPSDERRGERGLRGGAIAYLLVGALAAGLAAVTLVVLTNNKISDRESEIVELQQQKDETQARADALAPFAEFSEVESQRAATIKSLADSRFDWERVMRELGRVLPSNVWLTELSGSVTPDVTGGDTSMVSGPSLQFAGCTTGQEDLAGFLSALRDIDGVTRVGLTSSERPGGDDSSSSSSSSSGSGGGGGGTDNADCRTRDFITQFEVVAAFDAVATPAVPGAAPTTPTTPAPTSPTESTTASDTTAGTDAGS